MLFQQKIRNVYVVFIVYLNKEKFPVLIFKEKPY